MEKLGQDKDFATNIGIINLHFVELQKKLAVKGNSPCIDKKIIVVCNYWGLLVPTHDFLFNPKTLPDTNFAINAPMIMLPSRRDRTTFRCRDRSNSEKKIIL
ncbi:MAG: hypothetical protein F6K17_03265 [Okeania sp. SIO3C4]|nr:hypothetical protein [Okeania sp. SIO3C4]